MFHPQNVTHAPTPWITGVGNYSEAWALAHKLWIFFFLFETTKHKSPPSLARILNHKKYRTAADIQEKVEIQGLENKLRKKPRTQLYMKKKETNKKSKERMA